MRIEVDEEIYESVPTAYNEDGCWICDLEPKCDDLESIRCTHIVWKKVEGTYAD